MAGRPEKGDTSERKLALSLNRETGGSNRHRLILAALFLPPGTAKIFHIVYPPPAICQAPIPNFLQKSSLQHSPYRQGAGTADFAAVLATMAVLIVLFARRRPVTTAPGKR
jgi:hypothetical protein